MDKNPKHPLRKRKQFRRYVQQLIIMHRRLKLQHQSQRNILIRVNKSTNKEKVPRICLQTRNLQETSAGDFFAL